MCYKDEKHKRLAKNLSEKMVDIPRFITNYFNRYKSEASKLVYWGYIENLLQWLCENNYINTKAITDISPHDLKHVSSTDIINYLNSLKNGIGCSPNTLNTIGTKKNVFGAFWTYLVEENIADDNIIRQIPKTLYKSEVTDYEVKVPSDLQLDSFLKKIADGNNNDFDCIRNTAIVQLFLGSGIRSEELIGLDMNDLYLNDDYPYIMILGKGKKEVKDQVFISLEAKYCLDEYLIKRDEFLEGKKEAALFLSNFGSRISKTSISSFFNRYSYGQINPHMLRHFVGTKLYNKTHDIVLVQRQLRHKSLETAARYYVHTSKEQIASTMMDL